jgi:hypothetical protein
VFNENHVNCNFSLDRRSWPWCMDALGTIRTPGCPPELAFDDLSGRW